MSGRRARTVAELREILDELPDYLPVMVSTGLTMYDDRTGETYRADVPLWSDLVAVVESDRTGTTLVLEVDEETLG